MRWLTRSLVSVVWLTVVAVVVSGCAGVLGLSGSAEQLRELVKDKSAACTRLDLMTVWGTQKLTMVNVDKGLVLAKGGNVTMSGETCDTDIAHEPPAPMGVSVSPRCLISSTNASLAEILRLADEVPECERRPQ